jgi:ribosome biogenesis GTPase
MKENRNHFDDLRHMKRDREIQKYAHKRQEKKFRSDTERETGVIGAIYSGMCVVHIGAERRTCRSLPGVTVGDEVEISRIRIVRIFPRRTRLSRVDPTNPREERVIAANVDVVVIVASVGVPPFRPGLVDRVLLAVEHGGATPIICVNKIDLLSDADDLSILDTYEQIGLRIIRCSCVTGEGLKELREAMRGQTCVFTGHSGVGKSSLINALCPELHLATRDVEQKGRHTTTSSYLHQEPDGTRLIDTPGVREFGLGQIGAADLRHYFPEFRELARGCRFSDCSHTHEPGCAVREAGLPRYHRYLRLL